MKKKRVSFIVSDRTENMDVELLNAKNKSSAAYNAAKKLLNSRLQQAEKNSRTISLAKSTFLKKWTDLENCHYEYISKTTILSNDQLEAEGESWNSTFMEHEDLLALCDDALTEMGPGPDTDSTNSYELTLVTKSGCFAWNGQKAINILLVGDRGESEADNFRSLDGETRESFDTFEFAIENVNVGNIQHISMTIPEDGVVSFYLEKITVKKSQTTTEFPIYEWITNQFSTTHIFTSNMTGLPQNDTDLRKKARSLQTKLSKQSMKWSHNMQGLPGSSGYLKMDEVDNKYRPPLEQDLEKNDTDAIPTFMAETPGPCYAKDKTEESVWTATWDTDEEFGRQALNGALPVLIKRLDSLPSNFPVTDSILGKSLQRGSSLAEEMTQGNIFLQDFEMLDGVSTVKIDGVPLALPCPMVLYYLRPSDELVPIAIQLGQQPGQEFPIWTPNDNGEDWLWAKMWVGSAIGQASQLYFHLPMAHFCMEVFAVALLRCLPPAHPVHKILKENFQFIVLVNTGGREIVLGGGLDGVYAVGSNGTFELLKKHFSRMKWEDFDYMQDLEKRGLDKIPNFPHRDDSSKVWSVMEEYVSDLVDFYYSADRDITEDYELQDFAREISEDGFSKLRLMDLPNKLMRKDELKTLLVRIIFTTTAKHSTFNFYEYQRFIPNSPYSIQGPLPTESDRGNITYEIMFDRIPSREKYGPELSGLFDVMTAAFSPKQTWLTEQPRNLFVGDEIKPIHDKFKDNLARIEKEMQARNYGLKVPHLVLKPSRIPAGIAI
eukprot:GFUD01003029.1.p1 GENE.GFUD01003029.1~~GFUD01003029.1.p1  ORF type:complete len:775 (-),score=184.02 GFUD01003029.1:82-2406(-)